MLPLHAVNSFCSRDQIARSPGSRGGPESGSIKGEQVIYPALTLGDPLTALHDGHASFITSSLTPASSAIVEDHTSGPQYVEGCEMFR